MEAKEIDNLIIKTLNIEYPSLIQSELPYYRAICKVGIKQGKVEGVNKVVEWLGLPENRLTPDSDLSLVDRQALLKEIEE